MDYLTLKAIHIISSTVLFGTGMGSAFFLFMANRRKEVAGIAFATRHVVIADWIFTTPSVVIQLVTGLALIHAGGIDITTHWIKWGLILYFVVGACWLPVVWIQIKMRNLAKQAMENNSELSEQYWLYDKWWITLGSLAFPIVLVIFYLMVFKPQ
ncbi:MAG: DUF2269 domain-containing protein [Gammaproteobacteria bacterium]|nr:DUF2269 domain-containing protein [Gammaproteobacteria bacterium]